IQIASSIHSSFLRKTHTSIAPPHTTLPSAASVPSTRAAHRPPARPPRPAPPPASHFHPFLSSLPLSSPPRPASRRPSCRRSSSLPPWPSPCPPLLSLPPRPWVFLPRSPLQSPSCRPGPLSFLPRRPPAASFPIRPVPRLR